MKKVYNLLKWYFGGYQKLISLFIDLHSSFLRIVIKRILKSVNPSFSCKLKNLGQKIRGRSPTFHYLPELDLIEVKSCGESFFVADRIRAFNHYDKNLSNAGFDLGKKYYLDKINFNSGDKIIDCGANVGNLYLWFKSNGISVDYLGVEPSPKEFSCLRMNIDTHKALNQGLWNVKKTVDFFVANATADSSIIEPKRYDQKVTIEAVPLSSIITSKIKLLKLEAEGAEPEILEGAGEKLNMIEYISADLGPERGVSEESTFMPVTNFLLERNFSLIKEYHVTNTSNQRDYSSITALFKNKLY